MLSKNINLKQIAPYFNILFYLKTLNWSKYFNPILLFNTIYFCNVFKKTFLAQSKHFKKQKFFHTQIFSHQRLVKQAKSRPKHKYRVIFNFFFHLFACRLKKPGFKTIGPQFTKKVFSYVNDNKNNRLLGKNLIRNTRKRFFYKFKTLKLQFFFKNLLKNRKFKNLKIFSFRQKLKLKKTLKSINVKPYLYLQKKQNPILTKSSLFQNLLTRTKSFYINTYSNKKTSTQDRSFYKNPLVKHNKKNKIISYWSQAYLKHPYKFTSIKIKSLHFRKQFYLKWFRWYTRKFILNQNNTKKIWFRKVNWTKQNWVFLKRLFYTYKNSLIIRKQNRQNFVKIKFFYKNNFNFLALPVGMCFKNYIFKQVKTKSKTKFSLNNHFIVTSKKVLDTKLSFFNGYKKFQPSLNVLPQKQKRKSYQNKLKLYWKLKNLFIKLVKVFNRSPFIDTHFFLPSQFWLKNHLLQEKIYTKWLGVFWLKKHLLQYLRAPFLDINFVKHQLKIF